MCYLINYITRFPSAEPVLYNWKKNAVYYAVNILLNSVCLEFCLLRMFLSVSIGELGLLPYFYVLYFGDITIKLGCFMK